MVIGWQRSGKQNVSTVNGVVARQGKTEHQRRFLHCLALHGNEALAFPYRPSNRAFHSFVKGRPRQHGGKRGFGDDQKTFSNGSAANH